MAATQHHSLNKKPSPAKQRRSHPLAADAIEPTLSTYPAAARHAAKLATRAASEPEIGRDLLDESEARQARCFTIRARRDQHRPLGELKGEATKIGRRTDDWSHELSASRTTSVDCAHLRYRLPNLQRFLARADPKSDQAAAAAADQAHHDRAWNPERTEICLNEAVHRYREGAPPNGFRVVPSIVPSVRLKQWRSKRFFGGQPLPHELSRG